MANCMVVAVYVAKKPKFSFSNAVRHKADDGYGTYCAMTAIAALQNEGKDHNRIVMLVGKKDLFIKKF